MTLLTKSEVAGLASGEVLAPADARTAPVRPIRPAPRAAMFLPGRGTDQYQHVDKHIALCLKHAASELYRVASVSSSAAAIIDLIEADLVDVVLAAVRWRAGRFDDVEVAAAQAGKRVEVIRGNVYRVEHRTRVSVDPLVARMEGMGFPPELIAEILASPVERVAEVLNRSRPGPTSDRRPERRARVVDLAEARTRRTRAG